MKQRIAIVSVVAIILAAAAAWLGLQPTASSGADKVAVTFDWIITGRYAPFILADEQGFYREENLSVSFEQGKGAETAAKLVDQGIFDIATNNAAATLIAIANGLRIRSVAMSDQDSFTEVFALKATGVEKPADLIGKRLGVRYFDASHFEYLAMMKAQGLDPTKVSEVSIGFDLQPLLNGQIDAMYNYAYNTPVQLKLRGFEISEIPVKDYGVVGYGLNIIASNKFATSRPNVLRNFLRATARGHDLARKNPEMAIAALTKRYPESDQRIALATLKAKNQWFHIEGSDTIAQFCQDNSKWLVTITTYQLVDLLKKSVNTADVFTNQFLSSCL
jgi:NitT/TauT family transport system substrate-binding protein